MTHPPRRTFTPPVPAARTPLNSSTVRAAPTIPGELNISPLTQLGRSEMKLMPRREKILLGGDTTSGKSYAWQRMAAQEFALATKEGRDPAKFFVLDTDNACPAMFNDGDEFDYLFAGNGGNVYIYPAYGIVDAATQYKEIHQKARAGDWIVIDVVNRLYDWAQERVAEVKEINLINTRAARQSAHKGFGAFGPEEWLLVRFVHDAITGLALNGSKANLLFLCHIKEVIDVKDRERREVLVMFDDVGFKPEAAPKLAGMMDTVVFLWAVRYIPRDERGKRDGQAYTARYATRLKDRGSPCNDRANYDTDFWPILQEMRAKDRQRRAEHTLSTNVTGELAEEALTASLAAIEERSTFALEDPKPAGEGEATDE